MECCKKLIRLRKQRGLTQQELAEAVDVSRQAISKWELGTTSPTVESLRSLSLFYGVPVDLLLDDELNLPDPSEVTPKEPPQQNKGSPAEENPLGNEIKKEIAGLKKWVIALAAIVAVLALAVAAYMAGSLQEGSDAIPIGELEQEYVGFLFDGEFDHGW